MDMPSSLASQALRRGLYTRLVGRRILYFRELGSTMDQAALEAENGAQEGTVVLAETQQASRGRHGRSWISRSGNLYCSVLLYPTLDALQFLSCLAGVAAVRAIRRVTGLQPRLKWPNDVLLEGRKTAGILIESVVEGQDVKYAVVGVGVNVSLDPEELAGIPVAATSLREVTGEDVPRDELLVRLLHELDALYRELLQGQTPVEEWKELLDTLGREVVAQSRDQWYEGLAVGVDSTGNLRVKLENGKVVTLSAEEVTMQGAGVLNMDGQDLETISKHPPSS